jgi:hypothetical protein
MSRNGLPLGLVVLLCGMTVNASDPQTLEAATVIRGQWTGVSGSATAYQQGTHGKKGVPSASGAPGLRGNAVPRPGVSVDAKDLDDIVFTDSGGSSAESYILPSSVFRTGTNAAEYRTDVRVLNQGASAVTVTATLYDQQTGGTLRSNPFQVEARNQVAFDNVLQSLFGRTLSHGAYGPIRFDTTGAILVAASVNNVNACGTRAVSGQWLPGIAASHALKSGVIGQLAVSTSASTGYRTNLVFMNPGVASATATVKVLRGGGTLLSTGTIGPLPANGFKQVSLDNGSFPGVASSTDANLWLEFTSDQPVLAYATIIHNVSGDPFAVVASSATPMTAGSYVLPSSVFRTGANAAEYQTDVRLLNQGTSAVTVHATFYDQVTSAVLTSNPIRIEGRNQAAFDNILQSLFGRTLGQGAYGPIRFEATGPLLVGASVNNVNACGTRAVSGQWLPGIPASLGQKAGVIGQLAASTSTNSGYRTNLVFMNPGSVVATATVKVRRGEGTLLSTGTIGPLPPNGFAQVPLAGDAFPQVGSVTDANLWLEFTSDQPVLAYATMIHNASGDPFAVVASSDQPPDSTSPPVAEFTFSPLSPTTGQTVTFTNQSTGATSYAWDLGEGTTSTATNPTKTYSSPGTFRVSLTATNTHGSNGASSRSRYDPWSRNPCRSVVPRRPTLEI